MCSRCRRISFSAFIAVIVSGMNAVSSISPSTFASFNSDAGRSVYSIRSRVKTMPMMWSTVSLYTGMREYFSPRAFSSSSASDDFASTATRSTRGCRIWSTLVFSKSRTPSIISPS